MELTCYEEKPMSIICYGEKIYSTVRDREGQEGAWGRAAAL